MFAKFLNLSWNFFLLPLCVFGLCPTKERIPVKPLIGSIA